MAVHDWTLVHAGIFHDFHHEWISTIKRSLNAGRLPANYYALAEQVAGGLGPDVLTLEHGLPVPGAPRDEPLPDETEGEGGVALAVAPPEVRHCETEDLPYSKRKRVVVRHVSGHRVVAIVEIVSPGNKASQTAFKKFVSKACELLDSGVHLLVIDLFAPTPRDPRGIHAEIWGEYSNKPFELTDEQPLVAVSYESESPKRAFAEVFAVGEPIPDMPLFLREGHYIKVPLESTYRDAWEAVPKFWRNVLQPASSRNGS